MPYLLRFSCISSARALNHLRVRARERDSRRLSAAAPLARANEPIHPSTRAPRAGTTSQGASRRVSTRVEAVRQLAAVSMSINIVIVDSLAISSCSCDQQLSTNFSRTPRKLFWQIFFPAAPFAPFRCAFRFFPHTHFRDRCLPKKLGSVFDRTRSDPNPRQRCGLIGATSIDELSPSLLIFELSNGLHKRSLPLSAAEALHTRPVHLVAILRRTIQTRHQRLIYRATNWRLMDLFSQAKPD